MHKNINRILYFLSGIANGLFGAGGGILAVEALNKKGLKQKNAQATALCATILMSVFTAFYYLFKGYYKPVDALVYIPFGIPGALTGSFLLGRLSDRFLKKLFGAFIIFIALRMILQ